jgi:chemotaxis protein MotB
LFSSTVKWLAVGSLLVSVLPGCVAYSKHAKTADELAQAQDELGTTSGQLRDAEDALIAAGEEREMLAQKAQLADQLAAQKAELEALLEKMKSEGAIATVDGTVLFTQDGMYGYRAQGDVIFSAGSDTLTAEGKKILGDVATQLKKNTDQIVVIGHTDVDPIVRTADKWPRGNMQLGAGRALSVSEYLVSQGIPETRIAIQSCGPYKPVASGNSAEAKKKNRRVEIMVKVSGTGEAGATN